MDKRWTTLRVMRARTNNRKQEASPDLLRGRVMLRVQEYAELTGTPAPSVYRYLASGKLPSIRLGNTLRIPVSAITEQLHGAAYAK
jgi:excisionase family DNA binding protein